ncbi:hypothetical protein ID866_3499 [Astraeus odoratus]|nr:hypothetical protein ID866_3499 [Astraeus odoratus]
MPVNYLCPLLLEQPIQEPPPTQTTKYCSCCSSPLTGDSLNPIVFLDDHDSNIVCGACRARLDSARADDSPSIYVDHGLSIGRPGLPSINASSRALSTTPSSEALFEDDIDLSTSPTSTVNSSVSSSIPSIRRPTSFLPSIAPRQLPVLSIRTPSSTSNTHHARSSPVRTESDYDREPSPDPSIDITRLRVRSQSCHCLYPGATFNGTQKSGRNSYDVTVTIVDVDLSSSFLCGYLCIRGLTEDWPELTTYFDAEIIGSRYGFLTQKWGASEEEDMLHWRRFPAFRHVGNELRRPCLTIPDRDRGAVFMRWKERFLVPDHKVHDINGASFAGKP